MNTAQTNNDYSELYGYKVDNNAVASPGAQTFTAPHDAFLSSVNLYFTAGIPLMSGLSFSQVSYPGVTMEIRNVINGVPGDKYYGRTTLTCDEINGTVDSSGNTPTNFKFDNPIFLQGGKQYAIVLYTAATDYQLAVSVIGQYDQNATDNVTTEGVNANQEVHGTFCYSMDGKTWNTGDPTTHLHDAANGTLCLKFDVNTAKFNTDPKRNLYEFYTYNLGSTSYSARNTNLTMNNMSYFTFLPSVFTPNNTSINWYYTLDDPNPDDAKPLIKNSTVPVPTGSVDTIYIWAQMNGSESISPVLNTGSMNLTVQATGTDASNADRQDTSAGLLLAPVDSEHYQDSVNPFSKQDDTYNAGEYISRDVDFKRQDESQNPYFNQIFASYEFQSNGAPRPSIYFNLNANNDDQNNYKNHWIPLFGYDENISSQNHPNGNYYIIDPYNSSNEFLDGMTLQKPTGNEQLEVLQNLPQRTYAQTITNQSSNSDDNWVRYHFHISLKRLFQQAQQYNGNCVLPYTVGLEDSYSPDTTVQYAKYPILSAKNQGANAYEIEFKIVFHTHSINTHPKLRRFRTSMNNSDQTRLSDINLEAVNNQ